MTTRRTPTVRCPLRPAEPCTLCHPDAKLGPQDCPTVQLVMGDDELRALRRSDGRVSA